MAAFFLSTYTVTYEYDWTFQTYTCDVFFAQSWKDDRLKWRQDDNITAKYRQAMLQVSSLQVKF